MNLGEWSIDLGSSPAVWEIQGDEWLHWFGVELAARLSGAQVTGSSFDANSAPFVEVRLQLGTGAGLRMLLGATADQVLAIATGSNEDRPDDRTLNALSDAVAAVGANLGGSGRQFEWEAFIGPSPGRSAHQGHYLEAPAQVGPLRLESTGVVHEEASAAILPSFSSWTIHRSVPISVTGTSNGYQWEIASMDAARDLRTLCGLLSLSSESEFSVRDSPWPVEEGRRHVPDRPPWYSSPPTAQSDVLPGEAFAAPVWISDCWLAARAGDWRSRALDVYLEGVYAESEHPSLAAVSYIAAVEAVATRLFNHQRCGECRAPRYIAASFRAAIRVVLDEQDASELDAVYTSRSKTVHQGSLHGSETTPGALSIGFWSADTNRDFRWRTLMRLRVAAGRLVRRALTDELPVKGPLP